MEVGDRKRGRLFDVPEVQLLASASPVLAELLHLVSCLPVRHKHLLPSRSECLTSDCWIFSHVSLFGNRCPREDGSGSLSALARSPFLNAWVNLN